MSAMKEMLAECLGGGYIPIERSWVDEQASRLGPYGGEYLAAAFRRYPFATRGGELVGVDAIPIHVARWLRDVLPDTADELDWALDYLEE